MGLKPASAAKGEEQTVLVTIVGFRYTRTATMKTDQSNSTGPLSAATFYVLFALASQDLHGYGIIQEVTRLSEGQYRIGPGTLYDNLKKLMNLGWAEDYEEDQLLADERRRMYRLTAAGRTALRADLGRMKRVLRIAGGQLAGKGREA